jgi:hypothetical protein
MTSHVTVWNYLFFYQTRCTCLGVFDPRSRLSYNAVGSPTCMHVPAKSRYEGPGPGGPVSPVDLFDKSATGPSTAADIGGGRATGKPAWNLRSDSMLDGSPA